MPVSAESEHGAEPARATTAGLAIGLVATSASVAIAVYALGSARSWWQGSSCALAACGADDLAWAWYTVAVVAAAVSALFVLWTAQMARDRRTEAPMRQ